jgi:hypothetical protein
MLTRHDIIRQHVPAGQDIFEFLIQNRRAPKPEDVLESMDVEDAWFGLRYLRGDDTTLFDAIEDVIDEEVSKQAVKVSAKIHRGVYPRNLRVNLPTALHHALYTLAVGDGCEDDVELVEVALETNWLVGEEQDTVDYPLLQMLDIAQEVLDALPWRQ